MVTSRDGFLLQLAKPTDQMGSGAHFIDVRGG